jgi:adenylate cyclase
MCAEAFTRKLTAIFSADAEGYSRLMGENDVETVRSLKACRTIIVDAIARHQGRVVDSPGDNVLAEFASVVDAVTCALELQQRLHVRNAPLPADRKMQFRIGISLGDVIADGDRIYGDGVNIAARLEKLAAAGGICLGGSAYEQVRNRIPLGCEYLGQQRVKNIATPVPAYRVWSDPAATSCNLALEKTPFWKRHRFPLAVAAVLLAVAGTVLIIKAYEALVAPPVSGPSPESPAAVVRHDKASIAVLPFDTIGDDPEQTYFSSGITNDIITDLSRFPDLIVTSSHAVFAAKDRAANIQELRHDLGVRYVLEGSVQKAGGQVRVNVQLIEADGGHHLWAERFDRPFEDIFAVQEEILNAVVRVLALKINQAERTRTLRKPTANLEAYDYVLRGYHHFYQRNRDANRAARRYFNQAVELDPNYAAAFVGLALLRIDDAVYGWTEFPNRSMEQAHAFVLKALSIDPSDARAHSTLGYIHMRTEAYDQAIDELQKAIELNPNDWSSYRYLGAVSLYSGRTDKALEMYETAMKYDPYPSAGMFMNIGIIHYLRGEYEDALKWLDKVAARWPSFLGSHIILAATYAEMDRMGDAHAAAQEVLRISPFFEVDFYGSVYRNPTDRAKIATGLHKAGLK